VGATKFYRQLHENPGNGGSAVSVEPHFPNTTSADAANVIQSPPTATADKGKKMEIDRRDLLTALPARAAPVPASSAGQALSLAPPFPGSPAALSILSVARFGAEGGHHAARG
jgi:hypothetical protein